MSNTISPSNPNIIDLHSEVGVWQYPTTPELDGNPAAAARNEYEHSLYVDALAAPDAPEAGQPTQALEGRAAVPVNELEQVPAAGEMHGYTTADGRAIDPAHAEAVFAATENVFNAYDVASTAETAPSTAEFNATAASQAAAYGKHLNDMRDRALIDWGAEGEV